MNFKIVICFIFIATMMPAGHCIGCKSGGEPVKHLGTNCVSQYFEKTLEQRQRNQAEEFCGPPRRNLVPASNHRSHVLWFAEYIGGSISTICEEEIWTSLSFDANDGEVHLPDLTTLSNTYYTWASGSPPNSSQPCLAAKKFNSSLFELLRKPCNETLPFICMGADTCDCAPDTCVTKFTSNCSTECRPDPETTTTTRAIPVTETSTTGTISSTPGTSTTTQSTISSTSTITSSTNGTVEDTTTTVNIDDVTTKVIIGGVIGAVVVLGLIVLVIYLRNKNRASPPNKPLKNSNLV